MKLAIKTSCALLLTPFLLGTVNAQLVPPQQDHYLHVNQNANFCCGAGNHLRNGSHSLAWLEAPGAPVVSDALTVEAWVFWDGSDLEEMQVATGFDTDQMTLFCGQRSYGFQYRSDDISAPDGWTFFLQTDTEIVRDTGLISLPLKEWAHLAATYDGAAIRTYVNGVQQTVTAASGAIKSLGTAFPQHCGYTFTNGPPSDKFGIGLGKGFTGGIRQLRIWNSSLTEAEIVANAGLHLDGTESGLLGYWPLDGPLDPTQAPNIVAGGPVLRLETPTFDQAAEWRSLNPLFVVREDVAEDVIATDCPSLPYEWSLAILQLQDVQNDGDLDLIFAGSTGFCGGGQMPFRALIRDGANGFVFDTDSAISGTVFASAPFRTASADFNGDGRLDVFSANLGEDFCVDVGAPNTLLLSRSDGLLEDASNNLLGPPCNADTPQFAGQHNCYAGGGEFGRTPGIRYPGSGEAVIPDPGFTHGVASGDIDGDGDVDILAGNVPHGNLDQPYFLLNDGNGGFLANWQLLPDPMYRIRVFGDDPHALRPNGVLLQDMDGDGHVDLVTSPAVIGLTGEWLGGIYWNDGSGDFSAAELMAILPTAGIPSEPGGTPVASTGPLAADIDNDGDKDLLVSWDPLDIQDPPSVSSTQILVNHGGRIFVDETVARIGAPPQAGMQRHWVHEFFAEDFNSDGCTDLLFPYDLFRTQDAGIWFNDCDGNFTPAAEHVLVKPTSRYVPLDYDGDGDIDLVSAVPKPINYAGTAGCAAGEGDGLDYLDFAVLINTSALDTDVDGVSDIHDAFDNDPDEWFDADSDGVGNNADGDDDNDTIPDEWERNNGNNVFDAADAGDDGDADGLTSLQEYQAGTDPRNSDTDGDTVLDGADNCPVIANTTQHDTDQDGVGNACEPVSPLAVADLNSNGSPEIAVLVRGSAHVHIRDGSTDELISDIDFGADDALQMAVLPDLDASGNPEIAVLNEQATGQVRVQIRDSVTGGIVSNLWYGLQYEPVSMAVVPDYNSSGFPEVAVLGSEAGTDAVRVQLRDADTGGFLDNVFLGTQSIAKDLVSLSDTSGNGIPEMGILGVLKANDQVRMQIWDADTSVFQSNVWFAKVYQPHSTITMPDTNSNGSDEIVAMGVDPATQNIRVQVRDSDTTATHYNIWLGAVNEAVGIALINDINSNGFPDLAVLLKTPAGTGRVRVQDGGNGAFIRNLFYTVVDNPVGLTVMPDYNSNGFDELAVLGENAGVRHVQILDTSSGAQLNRIDFP